MNQAQSRNLGNQIVSGSPVPPRELQITGELERLHRQVKSLGESVTHLHSRLNPALIPTAGSVGGSGGPGGAQPQAPLAEQIAMAVNEIIVLTNMVDDMTQRLEF